MKTLIYTSGILGGLLLLFRLIGTITNFSYNPFLLLTGIILVVICIFLIVMDRHRDDKRIETMSGSKKGKSSIPEKKSSVKTGYSGWSMNDSPFRERRSGLKWGGGNIKGANAERGSRRKFLR